MKVLIEELTKKKKFFVSKKILCGNTYFPDTANLCITQWVICFAFNFFHDKPI